jgi:hypothetical protein
MCQAKGSDLCSSVTVTALVITLFMYMSFSPVFAGDNPGYVTKKDLQN